MTTQNGKPSTIGCALSLEADSEAVAAQSTFLRSGTLKRGEHFRFDILDAAMNRVGSIVIKVWAVAGELLWSARRMP